MRVLGAWVSTGYDVDGSPLRSPLAEGAVREGVRATTSVTVQLDRFLLPASALRQAICLRPSTGGVESLDECSNPGQPFLEPVYSVADRTVTFYQQPGERLAADTFYRLTVYVPTEEADFGFRAFDGAALDRRYQFDFRTAAASATAFEEAAPNATRYCDTVSCARACRTAPQTLDDPVAQQACVETECGCLDSACTADGDLADPVGGLFAQSCAFAGCHAGGNPLTGVPWGQGGAAMGLDLSSPEALEQTALGRVAHECQTGEQAALGDATPARFGRAMPIVAPTNPGNSYLLYKLVAHPLHHLRSPAQATPGLDTALDELRASVVVGLPMPPDGFQLGADGDPDGARAHERLLLFEAWIAHGSVTRCP